MAVDRSAASAGAEGPLVGREDELATLAERLAPEGALVSLVGPPGVGTSRLGRDVAARFARFRRAPGAALARVRAADVESLELLLVDDVGARVLAVLEELEGLREGAPALRVLVVGSEALGVADEHVIELGVLPEEAAVRLYLERIPVAARRASSVDEVRALVRRLGALPLAVELAALQASEVGPRDIRVGPLLRRTFDPVWSSLADVEQHALAALATFAAPARLEDLEAVIEAPAEVDPLVAVETLVRRHLVLRASHRVTLAPLLADDLQLRTRGDVRFARLAARRAALGCEGREAPASSVDTRGWRMTADAAQTIAPDGARVELHTRPVLRRILAALVTWRVAAPGQALDVEALLAAGWPGERVQHAAGLLRVYTAIKRLRALGLQALLRTAEEGYLLDDAVPLLVSATPPG